MRVVYRDSKSLQTIANTAFDERFHRASLSSLFYSVGDIRMGCESNDN